MKKRVNDSRVELHHFMGPEHANLIGNVHGGIIMKLVDEAGALCAIRHAQRPAVTVAINSMTFMSPVRVGDVLNLRACLDYVGHSSMEVAIEVIAEDPISGHHTPTNSAFAVYVALDDYGKPCEVPELIVETDDEKRRWEEGKTRQARRLSRKQHG